MLSALMLNYLLGLSAADGDCGAARLNGTSFHSDIRVATHINEPGACCQLCSQTMECAIWTLNLATKTCYLRNNKATRFSNKEAVSGFTSAHVPTPPPAPTPPPNAPPKPYPPTPTPTPPPNPCLTCKGPIWDWERFPSFFHSADAGGTGNYTAGGFSDAALDTITRFPMVTIEKWQGSGVAPYMYEEDAWIISAKQIKKINPNITVVVWLDSFRIYTADKSLNPDLGKSCTTGHFRPAQFLETHPEYLLKNTSGLPALEPWSKCHIFDHTNATARNYWRDMCLTMTGSGVIDGCGADASWQDGMDQAKQWGIDESTAEAWEQGHKAMMKMTTEALADGVLLGKDPWEVGDYVNGALHEGCSADNATILTLRNLTSIAKAQGRRLVYQCHGGNGNITDEVAAFLIGVGEYQYYGLGGWSGVGRHGNFSEHYVEGIFDQRLGEPLADAQYDPATGTWSRSFASGTKVEFNAKTKKGSVDWGSALGL